MTTRSQTSSPPRDETRRTPNGLPESVFVHPSALCESTGVGNGTRIWAFAHVMGGARVGNHCNIGGHAFIEDGAVIGDRVTVKNGAMICGGVTIEDDAFIGPGVIFTNDKNPRNPRSDVAARRYEKNDNWLVSTRVNRGASIGAGAVIVGGIQLGAYSTVGAGAVVTRNVSAQRLVMGNPARVAGWVCRCGATLAEVTSCQRCNRKYRLVGELLIAAE